MNVHKPASEDDMKIYKDIAKGYERHTVDYQIRIPLNMTWNPKEDITAFELAKALPFFFGQICFDSSELKEARRHFIIHGEDDK